MKLHHLRLGVPLLDVSALPIFIFIINHVPLQQTRKSYITISRVRTSLVTESNTLFVYIKNICALWSFQKKVISPTVYPLFLFLFLATPRIEPRVVCTPGKCSTASVPHFQFKPYKTIHQITQEQQINTQDQCVLYAMCLSPQNH